MLKYVFCDKTISGHDTVFDFHVKFDIFWFFAKNDQFRCPTLTEKTTPFKHVSDKGPRAK